MSRVITFSRTYPSYHPKAGQLTHFIEKIWNSIGMPSFASGKPWGSGWHDTPLTDEYLRYIRGSDEFDDVCKHHTIRAGHRWKEGDWFSPRVWSGKPYNSKQITFAPDIQIKKVWDFKIVLVQDGILRSYEMQIDGKLNRNGMDVFTNDGLTYNDFCDWFQMDKAKKTIHFDGQIICWNESINY